MMTGHAVLSDKFNNMLSFTVLHHRILSLSCTQDYVLGKGRKDLEDCFPVFLLSFSLSSLMPIWPVNNAAHNLTQFAFK